MNWQEILVILVPILSLMGWVYSRLDKRFDKIDQRFDKVDSEISAVKDRVARIEGQLMGPPRFEPRILEKKEE